MCTQPRHAHLPSSSPPSEAMAVDTTDDDDDGHDAAPGSPPRDVSARGRAPPPRPRRSREIELRALREYRTCVVSHGRAHLPLRVQMRVGVRAVLASRVA